MAAIWKGSLTFGLVNIPVELRTAVRTDHISFRLLHEDDLSPVKYERICQVEGEPVPWNEIVKGYEYEKGKFVVMTDDDFKAAAIEKSKTIDILDFVKEDEIDPRYFETPYYLVPAKGADKAYALLREAIRSSNAVGVGKIIIRQTQHLAGIKVVGDALVLEIMRFSNELVNESEYNFPPREEVRPQELKMAEQLIENLAEPFDPSRYTDDYRANLMKIIKAKMRGKKIKLEEPEAEEVDSGVLDLMSRLRASLEQGTPKKGTKAKRSTASRPRAPRTARRKTA
jgi:DNA end-binding protein Ku